MSNKENECVKDVQELKAGIKEEVKQEKTGVKRAKVSHKPRFKVAESTFLVTLISEIYSIIDGKTTSRDIKDITRKAMAWQELTAKFNAASVHSPVPRTAEDLKKKWSNLKDEAKKQAAARKKHQIKTGGGNDQFQDDELLLMVEDIIRGAMNPIKSEFDSDSFKSRTGPVIEIIDDGPESGRTAETESVSTVAEDSPTSSLKDSPTSSLKEEEGSSKRKWQCMPSTPASSGSSKKKKAVNVKDEEDLYGRRAEELHEARMALLAAQHAQQEERHRAIMEILQGYRRAVEDRSEVARQLPPSFLMDLNNMC